MHEFGFDKGFPDTVLLARKLSIGREELTSEFSKLCANGAHLGAEAEIVFNYDT